MSNEIITVAQMRAVDEAAAKLGVQVQDLMENAGRAVADAIVKRFTPRQTLVLCGPGNNGGDGWVTARYLRERGWPVSVCSLTPRDALHGGAANAARMWAGAVQAPEEAAGAELYVDAMFGAGLSRPLEGEAARFGSMMAASAERVVAVDVPSGLNGDTGACAGEVCVRAAVTVTFVRKKPAHVLLPGRAYCGEVLVADIGSPDAAVSAQGVRLFENCPELWISHFPWPSVETHKHARGHAVVASGPHTRTGAARLAARAALRVGAGLVTVLTASDALAENAAHLTAIMLRAADDAGAYEAAAQTAESVVVGPAFGTDDEARTRLEAAMSATGRCPIVFDADALTLLAPLNRALDERDVLTPHIGEFKRAFPGILEVSTSRIEAARIAAQRAKCVVLLKGPDTVVAAPNGRAAVNTSGTPYLATAGSGDVLAGLISGLIAQGMASLEAAAAGAWLHGKCAEAYGPGLIAEDIPEILPRVLSQLASSRSPATPHS
ncbi:MAG: NAD(P)H-hydrate dehydratase [Proteobacteria bacterium]|nr:NAD(P)H-hydrate dehydratase [Pseudomonadota bacterium]